MRERLADYRLFFREFRQTFHHTGAVAPSGPALSRALAGQVVPNGQPLKILEVGPGTGSVTHRIVERMGPQDKLQVVELNSRFAERIRQRAATEAAWQPAADRITVNELPIEEFAPQERFDVIVSGLPLNNFSGDMVERIFQQFHRLAATGGRLSFFEYVAVRKAKSLLTKRSERRRLSGVERILHREFAAWRFARKCIVANMPPAWVHHLRLPGAP